MENEPDGRPEDSQPESPEQPNYEIPQTLEGCGKLIRILNHRIENQLDDLDTITQENFRLRQQLENSEARYTQLMQNFNTTSRRNKQLEGDLAQARARLVELESKLSEQ